MTASADDHSVDHAQTIAYPSPGARARQFEYSGHPHVVVLFGATGDLSRRKLLCGLGYLVASDLNADMQEIIAANDAAYFFQNCVA